jgi:Zinc carboxypeptidase
VDANRNFEYGWKKGASSDECSDFYGGPYALSEPETKLLSRFLMNSKRNIRMFISLSGYGRKLSFSSDLMSQELIDDLRDIARSGTRVLKSSKFTIDSKPKRSGSIDQFAMHNANINFSYNLETRDDVHGFFVPASSIDKNAKEMSEIIFGMAKRLRE